MKAAQEFICDMAENISMPDVYHKIRQLIEKPDARIPDFVKVIETDSMLSVRIIRMANSNFFGFSRKAGDLNQAISLIGIIQLHDLLLSCLCMRTFAAIPEQILNLKAFWQHGIQCGIAARTIAQYCWGVAAGNRFFTLGLLHEIGHAAMFVKAPELALQALSNSQAQNRSLAELEREYLGFDYGELGTELMQLWHLPKIYRQVAKYHLQPKQAVKAYRDEVQIIHMAHTFCQSPVVGRHRALFTDTVTSNPQRKQLPANIDDIILKEISSHSDTVLNMLWPSGAQVLPFKKRVA